MLEYFTKINIVIFSPDKKNINCKAQKGTFSDNFILDLN